MTAQMEGDEGGPIWFFSSTETELVQQVGNGAGSRALATFASKGHDLWAAVHGDLSVDTDRAVVDALWNPYRRRLVRGRQGRSQAGVAAARPRPRPRSGSTAPACSPASRCMLGYDPKDEYKDSVAKVDLG